MKRREFLKTLAPGIVGCGIAPEGLAENTILQSSYLFEPWHIKIKV